MKIINNRLDFEKIYPYLSVPPEEKYPVSYPCLGYVGVWGFGGMAEQKFIAFLYPPENVDFKTWAIGAQDGFKFAKKYEDT